MRTSRTGRTLCAIGQSPAAVWQFEVTSTSPTPRYWQLKRCLKCERNVHHGLMTGVNEIRAMYSGVTTAAADVMHLDHFGIEPSRDADLVVLQTRNPVEAIRLRATRLYVLRRGNVIAESQPQNVKLALGETKVDVDFLANTVRGD